MNRAYERVVIGGGINGLCAAWALLKRGVDSLAVIEAQVVGGDHGSSHGHSRITRSAYADPLYVRLMQDTHNRYWLTLQNDLQMDLKHPSTGIVFGKNDGIFSQYASAVINAGAAVEVLDVSDARQRYPQFNFLDSDGVLEDHTAGLIAAQKSILGLRRYLSANGVEFIEGCSVQSIDPSPMDIRISTNRGAITTQRVISCAGAWSSRLFPVLTPLLNVTLQKVYYWNLDKSDDGKIGRFPVWVSLGEHPSDTWYGLPSFGRPGIKIAQHRLLGDDDPDMDAWLDEFDINAMKAKLKELFRMQFGELSGWESCKYTVTKNEDFILDRHPDDNRIVIGAGFSGHGFKFGPLTGLSLASLCETGDFDHPLMRENRHRFKIQ